LVINKEGVMRCFFLNAGKDGLSAFFRPLEDEGFGELFLKLPVEVVEVETGELYNAVGLDRSNALVFFSTDQLVETVLMDLG